MRWGERAERRWQARRALAPAVPGVTVAAEARTFLHRSAQAVWDLLDSTDPAVQLAAGAVRVEDVAGTGPGPGRQRVTTYTAGAATQLMVTELVAGRPPRFAETRVLDGRFPVRVLLWIEHTGAGCHVRWRQEVVLPGDLPDERRAAWTSELQTALQAYADRIAQLD